MQTHASYVSFGEVSLDYSKANGFACGSHWGDDTSGWLERNKALQHIQDKHGDGLTLSNLQINPLSKWYTKRRVLCFRTYSYTPQGIRDPILLGEANEELGLSLARRALKEIWHYWLLWSWLAPRQAQIQGVCLNIQSVKGVEPTGIRLGTVWTSGDVSYSNALVAKRLFLLHRYGTQEGRGELYDWSL